MNEWKIVVSMIVFLFLFLVSIVYIRARTPIEVAPTTHWSKIETSLIPACQIHDRSSAQDVCLSSQDSQDCTSNPRVVVVGDVHGEFDGLREILFASNITKNKESQNCEWTDQGPYGTVLVQVGDIVDRGPGATEAWQCMRMLQSTAPKGSSVVRLVGNHEVWWLEGYFRMRHPVADSIEKIQTMVDEMKADIAEDKLSLAYVHHIHDVPLLFIHAGIRPQFLSYLKMAVEDNSAQGIVNHMNGIFKEITQGCEGYKCDYDNEIFEAGPDRGGKGIGGPLWTDFRTIQSHAAKDPIPPEFIQVVGHTASYCYQTWEEPYCIRSANALSAICVDGGMYLGGRSFMEVGSLDGHFRSFQMSNISDPSSEWKIRDLTEEHCTSSAVSLVLA